MVQPKNLKGNLKTVCLAVAAADVDTNTLGAVAITIGDLKMIEGISVMAGSGYTADATVSGNVATVYIYQNDASLTADGPSALVVSGSNLCILQIIAVGY